MVDPAGFFQYVESVDAITEFTDGLTALIATDAERVWQIAARHFDPRDAAVLSVYSSAIAGMVEQDPAGAAARLEPLATGAARDSILSIVAGAYAGVSSDEALAWTMSLRPPSVDAVSSVIKQVAESDLRRATEIASAVMGDEYDQRLVTGIVRAALQGGQKPRALADMLIGFGDVRTSGPLLSELVQNWMLREPDDALSWMWENPGNVDEVTTRAAARGVARLDIRLAVEYIDNAPMAIRQAWQSEVAYSYGELDPESALEWLVRLQGEPGYDELIVSVLAGASVGDVSLAVRFIDENFAKLSSFVGSIGDVAYVWSTRDPVAAAQWALQLEERNVSTAAVERIVKNWIHSDSHEMQQWTLQLPLGADRDVLLQAILRTDEFDDLELEEIVHAFSSNDLAQRSIFAAFERALEVADSEGVNGEVPSLLFQFLTDPRLREQAYEQLSAI